MGIGASHIQKAVKGSLTKYRGLFSILVFLLQVSLANYLSFIIKYGSAISTAYSEFLSYLPVLCLIRLIFYLKAKLYNGLWRYASITGQFKIITSATFGSVVFYLVTRYPIGLGYPRLVILIDWLLFIVISGGHRLLISIGSKYLFSKPSRKSLLIVGAGKEGEMIVRELENNHGYAYEPIGFIDDDKERNGHAIQGVPFFGPTDMIPEIVKKHKPDEILISAPGSQKNIGEIYDMGKSLRIPVKKLQGTTALREEDVFAAAIVVLSSVLLWSWRAVFSMPFNYDAGYYLSVAERINEGWKPFKDFGLQYPPVGMYCFALFRKIFGQGYGVYRFAVLIAELCSAALVFFLSGSLVKNRTLRFTGALFFLLLYLAYEGNCIELEYFVVVFSLIAILLLTLRTQKWFLPPFFAGIFFFLAVMSKQYGVAIIPALIPLLFKDPVAPSLNLRLGAKRTAVFLVAFCAALYIMLSYLGVDVVSFASELSGKGYGRYEKMGIAQMAGSIFSWKNIWLIFLLVLSAGIALRKFHFHFIIMLLLCVLSSSALYVRVYPHYYQLILPYGVLLLMGVVEYYFLSRPRLNRTTFETACVFFLCTSLLITTLFAWKNTVYFSLHGEKMQESLTVSKRINTVLPSGSPVLVMNEPEFSYLCNFQPPIKKDGYVWLYTIDLDGFDFMKAENIVWFDGWQVEYKKFLSKVEKTHEKIQEFSISGNKKVEIWKRRGYQNPEMLI